MSWALWLLLCALVYIVLRVLFVYFVCGGKSSGQNHNEDLEK